MNDFDSVIVSSRVRLARNLSDVVFPNKIKTETDSSSVINRVFDILSNYENYKIKDLSLEILNSLKEKHLISEDLTKNYDYGALSLSHDEQICVMLNEEEHIREQCILKGFMLDEALSSLNEVDDILLENLPIAFSNEYGFITTCPTNLGTGLRASAMMFLPALTLTNKVQSLMENLNNVGLTVRGNYGENSDPNGFLFQISNSQTLGLTEQQIIDNVKIAVTKICEKEIDARNQLLSTKYDEIKDRVCRAYGTLKYSYKIDAEEAIKLLSQVKLGICLNIIDYVKLDDVTNLLEDILPNTLKIINGENLSASELDKFRSKYIQQKI